MNSKLYYPISDYYRQKFGTKVYKVSVSVAKTCPNRVGLHGMETCIFCDQWGSAAYHAESSLPFETQLRVNMEKIRRRYKAGKFLVYFQAYTNSFLKIGNLPNMFEHAIAHPDVVGICIGTRPDCLPPGFLKMLARFAEQTHVEVELGAQSFDDVTLRFMKRGHDSATTLEAVHKLAAIPGVHIGLHLMFGWPGETAAEARLAAEKVNALPVNSVKLHNLHVLKHTGLETLYRRGEFEPVSLEDYAEMVVAFLRLLRPDIAVHRLAAVANRWDELIAPAWTKEKMRPMQYILSRLSESIAANPANTPTAPLSLVVRFNSKTIVMTYKP